MPSNKPSAPGRVKEITSVANPIIKDLRALHLRKHRHRTGLFLGEGLKLVTDALERNWPVASILYGKASAGNDLVQQTAAKVRSQGGDVLEVSNAVLEKVSRKDNPQTVVGVFEQRLNVLDELSISAGEIVVALDRVRDPGNLGTIIRTCDGLGVSGVILVGDCTDPFSLETVRATMGSLFHVPIYKATEAEFIAHIARKNVRTIGTHLKGAVDFRVVDYRSAGILLMGNEQQGLTESLAQSCQKLVRIPMAGQADSFNLAVSTGVVLFQAQSPKLVV